MTRKISLILWTIIGSTFGLSNMAKPSDRYFEVLMDRFEELYNDHSYIDLSDLKIRKVNKTRSLVGEMVLKLPMGNDITIEAQPYHKQGNEYRLMPYRIRPTPFCDFIAEDAYIYPDFAKNSDFPEDPVGNCPLQPGIYNARGVVFKLENAPRNAIPSGDFAGELTFKKDAKIVLQYRIYVSINNI